MYIMYNENDTIPNKSALFLHLLFAGSTQISPYKFFKKMLIFQRKCQYSPKLLLVLETESPDRKPQHVSFLLVNHNSSCLYSINAYLITQTDYTTRLNYFHLSTYFHIEHPRLTSNQCHHFPTVR